jgi:hypothetical protein
MACSVITWRGTTTNTTARAAVVIGSVARAVRRRPTARSASASSSDAPATFAAPGYHKLAGTQDAAHNDGGAADTLVVPARDAYLLAR